MSRPRRSVLYVPGSNARALEKSKLLPVDGLIFDLEDSVAPCAKQLARDQVVRALRAGGYGTRELLVRVNSFDTPWGEDDLLAVANAGADAVLLPKVDRAATVTQAAEMIRTSHATDEEKPIAIWCMMETPRGILHAEEIADEIRAASLWAGGLVMGTSDLAKSIHALHTKTRLPLITSLSLCLLAARAARVPILDGVFLDLSDIEGFEASCRQGREMGFDGKTLIHPKTVEAANRIFAPTDAEIAQARRVIEAFGMAVKEGKAVAVVDGALVERLHAEDAKRLLSLSEAVERAKV